MSEYIVVDGVLQIGKTLSIECDAPGLAYGFGVFETIKTIKGRPCFFREHYERLYRGVGDAGLSIDYTLGELQGQCIALLKANRVSNGALKIVCFSERDKSRLVVHLRDFRPTSNSALKLRFSEVAKSTAAFVSKHKTLNYLENYLELQAAREHGFDECLFANDKGELTECAASNIFFLSNGRLLTPSLDCGLLDGVIRNEIIRVAEENGIGVIESRFALDDLQDAEESFITNSAIGIVSVDEIKQVNGATIYFESDGVTRLLREKFQLAELKSVEALNFGESSRRDP